MGTARDPNIYDQPADRRGIPGYESLRSRVGDKAGSRKLGAGVWELEPGQAAYPYHFHLVEEEMVIVLEGTPLLRDPDGWRRLERGALVAFPAGEEGGHQVVNDGSEVVRFLAISTSGAPDIACYPDQNKIGVFQRPPAPGNLWKFFDLGTDVDYHAGLEPVDPPDGL